MPSQLIKLNKVVTATVVRLMVQKHFRVEFLFKHINIDNKNILDFGTIFWLAASN